MYFGFKSATDNPWPQRLCVIWLFPHYLSSAAYTANVNCKLRHQQRYKRMGSSLLQAVAGDLKIYCSDVTNVTESAVYVVVSTEKQYSQKHMQVDIIKQQKSQQLKNRITTNGLYIMQALCQHVQLGRERSVCSTTLRAILRITGIQ